MSLVKDTAYYNLLGVAPDADLYAIKRAFRKLALTQHPDRGGDAEKFKELSAAYEVLSDDEKRCAYDEHGKEFADAMAAGANRLRPTPNRQVMIPITLADVYNGSKKQDSISRNIVCVPCKGSGHKSGRAPVCGSCKGQGMKVVAMHQVGPGMFLPQQAKCTDCQGRGSALIVEPDRCATCNGRRMHTETYNFTIEVQRGAGIDASSRQIILSGEAGREPNTSGPGDIVCVLELQKSDENLSLLRATGSLVLDKTVSLVEALTGCEFDWIQLDGRKLHIQSPMHECIKPGTLQVVRGEGMPFYGAPHRRGDLYVRFDVDFPLPSQLSPGLVDLLRTSMPRSTETTGHDLSMMADSNNSTTCTLEDIADTSQEMKRAQIDFQMHLQQQQQHQPTDDDHHERSHAHPVFHHMEGAPQCRQQ